MVTTTGASVLPTLKHESEGPLPGQGPSAGVTGVLLLFPTPRTPRTETQVGRDTPTEDTGPTIGQWADTGTPVRTEEDGELVGRPTSLGSCLFLSGVRGTPYVRLWWVRRPRPKVHPLQGGPSLSLDCDTITSPTSGSRLPQWSTASSVQRSPRHSGRDPCGTTTRKAV